MLVKLKHIMMIGPVNANHHKTQYISHIRWPQHYQGMAQCGAFLCSNLRHFYFKNEQCYSNREHAIAKGFDALSCQIVGIARGAAKEHKILVKQHLFPIKVKC